MADTVGSEQCCHLLLNTELNSTTRDVYCLPSVVAPGRPTVRAVIYNQCCHLLLRIRFTFSNCLLYVHMDETRPEKRLLLNLAIPNDN